VIDLAFQLVFGQVVGDRGGDPAARVGRDELRDISRQLGRADRALDLARDAGLWSERM